VKLGTCPETFLGHLGKFTLSLHWLNLGNQPVEILIEDVYLLVVPSPQTNVNPQEEEERAYAAKAERLDNAELLHMRGQPETAGMAQRIEYKRQLTVLRGHHPKSRLVGIIDG
jgi:hypothetical protein